MVRGGTIFAGVAALISLGGCHILFGHDPTSTPAGSDGRPRDGISGELRLADGPEIDGALLPDGPLARDGAPAGEGIVFPPELGPPPCDPKKYWCSESKGIADLNDVWGSDDGKLSYAVGESVVLVRDSDVGVFWQPLGSSPGASWRAVHMVGLDAWVVGNVLPLSGVPQALKVGRNGPGQFTLDVVKPGAAIADHILHGVWMTAAGSGYVAATRPGGGAIDEIAGNALVGGQTSSVLFDVSGNPSTIWKVGPALIEWIGNNPWSTTWATTPLNGFPVGAQLRAVVALAYPLEDFMCTCGADANGTIGVLACCTTASCTVASLSTPCTAMAAAPSGSSKAVFWLVLNQSLQRGEVQLSASIVLPPQLTFQVNGVNAVWAAVSSNPRRLWAVGPAGTVLYHEE